MDGEQNIKSLLNYGCASLSLRRWLKSRPPNNSSVNQVRLTNWNSHLSHKVVLGKPVPVVHLQKERLPGGERMGKTESFVYFRVVVLFHNLCFQLLVSKTDVNY